MTCPFLQEAQVKYCRTAAIRKLIPLAQSGRAEEKCTSGEHRTCKVFQTQAPPEEAGIFSPCPYLRESLMQYCAAAAVTRFVPHSESLLSRCGNESFRYCELYLSMAQPGTPAEEVDGLAMPGRLRYSANHLWLDVSEDGICHAGIDAFLSRVLGPVDRLTFVQVKGQTRPAAVLTVNGVDLEVTFPNAFLLTACNLYLRANPSRIAYEPYTGGWLFEGQASPETLENLIEGPAARRWMQQEQRRLAAYLQEELAGQTGTMADGGLCAASLAHRLDRDRMLVLFHEFFSPYPGGKRI
jgi:glycine cleavage system H lipoate-binding protein